MCQQQKQQMLWMVYLDIKHQMVVWSFLLLLMVEHSKIELKHIKGGNYPSFFVYVNIYTVE